MFQRLNRLFRSRKFNVILTLVILLSSVLLMMFGVYVFMVGFHNMDSGHNLQYVNNKFGDKYDFELVDYPTPDKFVTAKESYIGGIDMMFESILYLIAGAIMFGVSLDTMIYMSSEESFIIEQVKKNRNQ